MNNIVETIKNLWRKIDGNDMNIMYASCGKQTVYTDKLIDNLKIENKNHMKEIERLKKQLETENKIR